MSNIVRTSHYPQSRHFLDACDELGLLVLEEIPGWQQIGDEAWKKLAVDKVARMIRHDWNRPSIVYDKISPIKSWTYSTSIALHSGWDARGEPYVEALPRSKDISLFLVNVTSGCRFCGPKRSEASANLL